MTVTKMYVTPRQFLVHEELMAKVGKDGGFYSGPEEMWLQEAYSHFSMMTKFLETLPDVHINRPVFAEIINNIGVNAFAYASSDENYKYDFIAIYGGSIASALEICNRLMSLESFLPDVGGAQMESSDRTLTGNFGYWAASAVEVKRTMCIPNDPVRRFFAHELAMKMIEFMFFHEAAHLQHGHLEFVKAQAGLTFVSEEKIFDPKKIKPIIRQVLEMDADAGAIMRTLYFGIMQRERFIPVLENLTDHDQHNAYLSLVGDQKAIVRSSLIASVLCYRLFQDNYNSDWDPYMQEGMPYPAVPMREHLTGITLVEILKARKADFGLEEKEGVEMFVQVKMDIEKSMAFIEGREISDVHLSPAKSPKGLDYLKKLSSSWNEIRPSLLPNVRRGKIADAHE